MPSFHLRRILGRTGTAGRNSYVDSRGRLVVGNNAGQGILPRKIYPNSSRAVLKNGEDPVADGLNVCNQGRSGRRVKALVISATTLPFDHLLPPPSGQVPDERDVWRILTVCMEPSPRLPRHR